jgi:hypothetical protein
MRCRSVGSYKGFDRTRHRADDNTIMKNVRWRANACQFRAPTAAFRSLVIGARSACTWIRRGGALIVTSFFGMQEVSARLHDRADLQERMAAWVGPLRPVLAPAVVRQFFTPARGVALDNPRAQCVLSCTIRSHYALAGR